MSFLNKVSFGLKFNLFVKKDTLKKCPSCGSKNLKSFKNGHEYLAIIKLTQCEKCSLVFQNPRISESIIHDFYKNDYRKVKGVGVSDNQFERGIRRGNGYIEYITESISDYSEKSVLEIGSATGGILKAFEQKGAKVQGVEWDKACVEFANSKGVSTLDDLKKLDQKFDLIILSHVLEHIHSPETFLKDIKKHIKDNGFLFISVPGLKTSAEVFKRTIQVGHLYYFDESTLRKTLENASYKIISSNEKALCLSTPEN